MRKQLAIGVSLFLLCGLGGKSEKVTLFPTQVLPQRYTHLIETSQSQTFEPYLGANLIAGLPYRLSYQIAKIYFITDDGRENPKFDIEGRCSALGYTQNSAACGGNTIPGKACPYDDDLVEGCYAPDGWCQKYGYTVTVGSCNFPEFPQDSCPHNENLYSHCGVDKEQACESTGYQASCEVGYIHDEADVCSYDSSYKKCVCNPCDGYDYSFDEANEQGYHASSMFCNSCGTIKYKKVENNCDGYKLCEYGGSALDVCWSGSTQYFKECDTNCENKCTLLTCPLGMYCEYESCTKIWCIIGCGNGKIDIDGFCKRPNTDCDSLGYRQNLTSCAGRFALSCPFDTTKYHCF